MDDQRRKLCQAAGLVLAGSALPGCGNPVKPVTDDMLACGTAAVSLGMPIADVPMDTAMLFMLQTGSIFLCRDSKGVYAVDARCTHLMCDVTFVNAQTGFSCPCHNSGFDFNGEHPQPPATIPLPHYLVCATVSGIAVVDPEQVVDSQTRYHL
jgi:Rieske Fe-S protein